MTHSDLKCSTVSERDGCIDAHLVQDVLLVVQGNRMKMSSGDSHGVRCVIYRVSPNQKGGIHERCHVPAIAA